MKRKFVISLFVAIISFGGTFVYAETNSQTKDSNQAIDHLRSLQTFPGVVEELEMPKIGQPQWYKDQIAAEEAAARAAAPVVSTPRGGGRVITYTVSTIGNTRSNLAEFASQSNQTLNNGRGWAQLGFTFKQVATGGSFNLILAEASRVGSYPGCSADWSCRVGASVLINDDRWQYATTAWNNAGGGLRDYRHMVVNHEVGHWLGHGHASCGAPGSYAPVMQQQSISLQGCKFNPWPLSSELWSSR